VGEVATEKEDRVKSADIEKRVAVLEEELASLRRTVEGSEGLKPWWERIAVTFENDPIYEQAMKLGRQYRRSLKPDTPSRKRK
jgi:hypothetical protein